MTIDPLSLIVGAIVAAGLGALIVSQRGRLAALQSSVKQQATRTRERLSRSADARYREAVIKAANAWHLAGHLFPLEQVAVLPRFYTLRPPYDPSDEDAAARQDPLELLPLIPDLPQLIAQFPLNGIPLDQLLRGNHHLALLGPPGSGRSITLALMTILAARQTADDQPGALLDHVRLPVPLHLADLELSPDRLGDEPDPLSPLFDAVRWSLPGVAGPILNALQKQCADGGALILADGWDEVPPDKRPLVTGWLEALLASYSENRIVVSGPARGFQPLQAAGFQPVFILPFSRNDFVELAEHWATAWEVFDKNGDQEGPAVPPETVRVAVRNIRLRSPLDGTLKVWATYAGDAHQQGRLAWYGAYIDRITPAAELQPGLEAVGERYLATWGGERFTTQDVTHAVNAARRAAEGRVSVGTPGFVYSMIGEVRLLSERATKQVAFTHPTIGAYLAARYYRDADYTPELLQGDNPLVELMMPFLAGMADVTPYVEARLQAQPSIGLDELLSLAIWAADAEPSANWQGGVFTQIARIVLDVTRFPHERERAMAALVAARDLNVGFVFRQGVEIKDIRTRILCALGLGATGDPESLLTLGELLNDSNPVVETASTLALGALDTTSALDYLIHTLVRGSEMARRSAAQIFAANFAGEGHDILKEALGEQDPATRRATIDGLSRIDENWSLDLLRDAEAHDEQWMVRSAATHALEILADKHHLAPTALSPEDYSWLSDWVTTRDEFIAAGEESSHLIRALQEGNESIRLASAEWLAALAAVDAVNPLYGTLADPHPEIRDAAHRALCAISRAMGCPLPGVG
jgi:HEAT repeat protein